MRIAKLEEFLDARMLDIESGIPKMAHERVVVILEFPRVDKIREPVERLQIE